MASKGGKGGKEGQSALADGDEGDKKDGRATAAAAADTMQEWLKEVDSSGGERLRAARDSADFARTGGKRAARVVQEATVLPPLPCLTLEEKDVDLAELVSCGGKISLVCFGFQASSDGNTQAPHAPARTAVECRGRLHCV